MISWEVRMDKNSFSVIATFKMEIVNIVSTLASKLDELDPKSTEWAYFDGKINGLLDAVQILDKQILEDKNEKSANQIL